LPCTIAAVNALFADGAESVTLTRDDWRAILEVVHTYAATGNESRKARREAERVKRVSRPVWRACISVAASMRKAMKGKHLANPPVVALARVETWEMRLRHSMDVSWQDLPTNHPKRMRTGGDEATNPQHRRRLRSRVLALECRTMADRLTRPLALQPLPLVHRINEGG
jgi:hypothetical protein